MNFIVYKTKFIYSMHLIFQNQSWLCDSLISVVEIHALLLDLELMVTVQGKCDS